MNGLNRILILVTLTIFLTLPFGCGGCDDTGGTTLEPDDVGLVDVSDASDTGGESDTDAVSADVSGDTEIVAGEPCPEAEEGELRPCGSDVGECVAGAQYCIEGFWTECIGGLGPQPETCNGRDNNCSGTADDEPDICPESVCYGASQCVDGACAYDASTALDCSHLDTPCMIGLCVDKEGECIQVPREEGTTCNDGNLCTVDEGVCQAGECIADVKDCSGAGDQCNGGVCDPASGECLAEPISDGTVCDDALFCTINTTCQEGQCLGQARNCSESADQCNEAACSEELGCHALPLTGNECSDGLYCTINDTCNAGVCVGGGERDCSADGGSCRTGVCDETARACTGDPVPDGTLCNDDLFCTTETACIAGECADVRQTRDCSAAGDGVCTTGLCDEGARRCDATPVTNGTVCDDGRACTTDTTCNNGACLGAPVSCDNLTDVCNSGRCSEAQGGCYADPRPNGTVCNDGLNCTVNTTCNAGSCEGSPRSCAGLNGECVLGTCEESAGGCTTINRAEGTSCEDGAFCTVNSTCSGSNCTGGNPRDCSGVTDICNLGFCDATNSTCATTPVDCSYLDDQCNTGGCSPTQGCITIPRIGQACNDGLACTQNETCNAAGTCQGQPVDCSGLDTQCTVGACTEAAGGCFAQNRPDGTSCNDGQFCNAETTCAGGACTNVVATRDCSNVADSCHVGECNTTTKSCQRVQTVFPCMTVSITGAPEARTWTTEAIFEFECSDPPCQYECRVDNGSWMPCTSPEEYIGFSLGNHTFDVRARKNGGEWTDPDRHDWEVYLPSCADAAAGRLYIGCEYWPVVLDNPVTETFREHFALVVTNPLPGTTAQVSVYAAGTATPIATAMVPGNELRVIRLPWNAMPSVISQPGNSNPPIPRTQKGSIAYRMQSDIPVNAYQFNPLLSFAPITCTKNNDCPLNGEPCTAAGICAVSTVNSFSNDASLLLPAHIFGLNSQYIVPSLPHIVRGLPYPAYMAIVATQDNTEVRIRNRGYTAAGTGFTAMNPGDDRTVILNRHEVLQIATRAAGAVVQAAVVPTPPSNTIAYEYPETDLTGSIVSSNKPIALYSGANCRQMPFNYQACDHVEQQVFPLDTLGHAYVGAVSALAPGVNPATAPVKGDVWRLVAVQNNTQLTITPASVHTPVTLDAGEWIEFTSDEHFYVESQGPAFPIMLTQYLISQGAHGGSQGDPSMILPAPVGQYRQQSIFTTPQEIASHYVNIVRTAGTSVSLDASAPPESCWQAIAGTNFEVCSQSISEGVHTISAANGVGITVYGYDFSVSYGYTGGLGLLPTTAINPDW